MLSQSSRSRRVDRFRHLICFIPLEIGRAASCSVKQLDIHIKVIYRFAVDVDLKATRLGVH